MLQIFDFQADLPEKAHHFLGPARDIRAHFRLDIGRIHLGIRNGKAMPAMAVDPHGKLPPRLFQGICQDQAVANGHTIVIPGVPQVYRRHIGAHQSLQGQSFPQGFIITAEIFKAAFMGSAPADRHRVAKTQGIGTQLGGRANVGHLRRIIQHTQHTGMLGMLYDAPEVAHIGPAAQLRPNALGLCYPVAVSWGATHEGSFENLCGDDKTLRERLSLERLVRPDMPPVYLWHTRDDDCVPVRNSLILANALEEAGGELAMRIYRHGWHGLSVADAQVYPANVKPEMSPDVPGWPEEMMGFFREIGLKIKDLEQTL